MTPLMIVGKAILPQAMYKYGLADSVVGTPNMTLLASRHDGIGPASLIFIEHHHAQPGKAVSPFHRFRGVVHSTINLSIKSATCLKEASSAWRLFQERYPEGADWRVDQPEVAALFLYEVLNRIKHPRARALIDWWIEDLGTRARQAFEPEEPQQAYEE